MDFNLFLLLMVVCSLIVNILIVVLGFKAKDPENLGLIQTLPTVFVFSLFYVGLGASEAWFSMEDSDGYGFGFLVILPTMAFAIISTTVLGVVGLAKMSGQGNLFLTILSMFSATVVVTYAFGSFAFPTAFVIILFMKVKRKWKQKRDKAPNIIG